MPTFKEGFPGGLYRHAIVGGMRKLVVLDGVTLNPGDLSWDPVAGLVDEFRAHDRTRPEDTVPRLGGARLALTNKVRIDAGVMDSCPDLRFIGVLATGYDVIDIEAARGRGIVVSNVPSYSTDSVVQWVWGVILNGGHRICHHASLVRGGAWGRSPDFCLYQGRLTEFAGKTLGVVGFGRIGRAVARVGHAFGMDVVVHTRTERDAGVPVRFVGLDELCERADVISLHCPLTPDTRRMIDAGRLARMRAGTVLVNAGRGPLVDEAAVAEALGSGRLGGFAADVLTSEPPVEGSPLIGSPGALVTPHIAWATVEARQRLMDITASNVAGFLEGSPRNRVDGG